LVSGGGVATKQMGLLGALGGALKGHVSDTIKSILGWASLGLMVLIALSLHDKFRQRKARKRVEQSCKGGSSDSIFVALVGHHSTRSTAQALFSLFDAASCPKRVRVGVYELVDEQAGSLLDMYARMAEKYGALGLAFRERVTVLKRFAEDQGLYGALWELMEHAYAGEAFVLTLDDSTQMHTGWDEKLINASLKAPPRSALVLPTASDPSFLVLERFEEGLPVLGRRRLQGTAADAVASKFWAANASFARAGFWARDQPAALPSRREQLKHLTIGTDLLVTCDALQRGWRFLHPAKPHTISRPLATAAHSMWQSTRASRRACDVARESVLFSELQPQLQRLGLRAGSVQPDAALGMVAPRDAEEAAAKYGSLSEYTYAASKVRVEKAAQ